MTRTHEQVLETIFAERERIMSRRSLLSGGAKIGLGGALAFGLSLGAR